MIGPPRHCTRSRSRSRPALLLLVAAALLATLRAASAQDALCCNEFVRFGGSWIGLQRQCPVETATPEQRAAVCGQLGRNICDEVATYCYTCDGNEAREQDPGGNSLGPGDPFFEGLAQGVVTAGVTGFEAEHLGAQERDGRVYFQIRIDGDGCPLLSGACVRAGEEYGNLPDGKQVGAKQLLLGSIQVAGGALRVSGRYVNVETGVIEGAAVGPTVNGTGSDAVAESMAGMLRELGLRCTEAQGFEY
jgi:hypothetical protein